MARNRQGGGALFSTTGIDIRTSSQLLYTLNNVLQSLNPSGTETIFNTSRTFTSSVFSRYLANGEANTDGAIYIRLFEPLVGVTQDIKSFTTSLHQDHGEVNQGRWWRAVYMKNGILTLWMADPYRNITGADTMDPLPTVTNALVADMNSVLTNYPNEIKNMIMTANNVASHQSQPNTSVNSIPYTNPAPNNAHYAWLPSIHEVQTLWGLSAQDKECASGGYYNSSWLRSLYDSPVLVGSNSYTVHSDYKSATLVYTRLMLSGSSINSISSYKHGWWSSYSQTWLLGAAGAVDHPAPFPNSSIRPAIHIDLNQLPAMDTSYVGDARISVGVEVG